MDDAAIRSAAGRATRAAPASGSTGTKATAPRSSPSSTVPICAGKTTPERRPEESASASALIACGRWKPRRPAAGPIPR